MDKKALFIYTHLSTFVRGDLNILQKFCEVKEYRFINNPKWRMPLSLIALFVHILINIRKYKFVYIWFADYHSFLPALLFKIFGKKSFLVIGGYDVCKDKIFNYGSFTRPIRSFMTLSSINYASVNLCVSRTIYRTVRKIAPKANSVLIYNGINITPQVNLESNPKKEVLCVALASSSQAFYVKGIDRYNSAASLFPETKFNLVGCDISLFSKEKIKKADNLTVIPAVSHNQLISYYKRADVYCQLSRHESFSLSLAEAMSYGLTPVITDTGGMAEVTGPFGHKVHIAFNGKPGKEGTPEFDKYTNSISLIAEAVKDALGSEKSKISVNYIKENFSLEKREKEIRHLFQDALSC